MLISRIQPTNLYHHRTHAYLFLERQANEPNEQQGCQKLPYGCKDVFFINRMIFENRLIQPKIPWLHGLIATNCLISVTHAFPIELYIDTKSGITDQEETNKYLRNVEENGIEQKHC